VIAQAGRSSCVTQHVFNRLLVNMLLLPVVEMSIVVSFW
jgi:hypothetical protein